MSEAAGKSFSQNCHIKMKNKLYPKALNPFPNARLNNNTEEVQ